MYSVARLTLYALLSAIEEDLRSLILYNIGHGKRPVDVLGFDLYESASMRLERDLGVDVDIEKPSLEELLTYIDFADAYQVINKNSASVPPITAKYIKSITNELEKLVPIRNRVAHSRPLNFDDLAVALDTVNRVMLSADEVSIWKDLKTTISQLRNDPSFVLSVEIPTYYLDETNQNHNLPIPDFDETGFIGRRNIIDEVTKYCLGPYPVITIIGDGGIGKTALVLKVAYDILDMDNSPFDAVVWTSSKTTQLTAQEITRIEGAIETSLGMFQSVADHLAGDLYENPMDEVINYLKEFRILLILDNLETVLDERVKTFLHRLPQGSKILITSRIGLGAFEVPVKLHALNDQESVELLRTVAKMRGTQTLVQTDNNTLAKFCQKMHNNPGYIKWFVATVQAGKRPEEVLDSPDAFLSFCMSNVYKYLDAECQDVLKSMLVVPGKHSQAQLAYLTGMNVLELQQALQQLLTTNMVRMDSKPRGSSFETKYEISDLPREYLGKMHPPTTDEYKVISKRKRQLIAEGEEYSSNQENDPYSIYNISMRSQSDLVIAKYLQQALEASKRKNFDLAEDYVKQARGLAPEFYEVHRVDAWIKVFQDNISAANDSYEAAIELAQDNHAPLMYWYAGFLMRYMEDTKGAVIYFEKARNLDSKSFEIRIELARSYLYMSRFDESQQILEEIMSEDHNISQRDRRKLHDLYLQVFERSSDSLVSQKNYSDALQQLIILKQTFENCPPQLVDDLMRHRLHKAVSTADTCVKNLFSTDREQAIQLREWLFNASNKNPKRYDSHYEPGQVLSGNISDLPLGKYYGFIKVANGERIFFHRNDLYDTNQWDDLSVGTKVKFTTNTNSEGIIGVGVRIIRK